MKIPTKYQIFDDSVEIQDKDVERLSSCIGGWNRLHELFLLGSVNEPDLKRLVVIRLNSECRRPNLLDLTHRKDYIILPRGCTTLLSVCIIRLCGSIHLRREFITTHHKG